YFLAAPGLGERTLRRSPRFIRSFIPAGAARREAWTQAQLAEFAAVLRQPERARASALIYRQFLARELPRILRGRYTGERAVVPVLATFGERSPLLHALQAPAPREHVRVEIIPGAGHYPAEEAPAETLELIESFLSPS